MKGVAISKLSQALPILADHRFGIIKELVELKRDPGAPDFFFYRSVLSNIAESEQEPVFPVAGGTSMSRDHAMLKAAGEAIERYGALERHADPHWLWSNHKDIKNETLDISEYALYDKSQYKYPDFFFKPFTSQSNHRWSSCTNAINGNTVWIPSSFIYLPYRFRIEDGEVPIRQPISTGLAAHESYEQAALNGLCEVVERDSIMITWQAALSRPLVDLSTLPSYQQNMIDSFKQVGYDIKIICTTNDSTIPSFLLVLKGNRYGNARYALSGSAGLNASLAIGKGIEELALIERAARNTVSNEKSLPILKGFTNIKEFTDHIRIWSNPKMLQYSDFLTSSKEVISFNSLPNLSTGNPKTDFSLAVKLVSNTGYTVLTKDITPSDLTSMGLYVVRTIVPGYQPLSRGFDYRILGSPRLWKLPHKMGYKSKYTSPLDYPYPHPFA